MSDSIFDALTNPGTDALLGMAQGFGQAAMPSRMPIPIGAVIGQGGAGALQGLGVGQQLQKQGMANQQQRMLLDWYKNMYGPNGNAGSMGAPQVGANGQYLTPPAQLKGLADLAMASGNDRTAATLYGLPNTMAGGAGYAMSPTGTAFPVPGGAADPGTAAQLAYAKERASGLGGAPFKPPTTITEPDGAGGFRQRTLPIPDANAAASRPSAANAPAGSDPYTAAPPALQSIPDPKIRNMAVNALLSQHVPIAAWAPFIAGIHHESGWNPGVPDNKNADGTYDVGLGQINSGAFGQQGITEAQARDPQQNLNIAARYFAQKWGESGGSIAGTYAGYNTGSVTGTPSPGYLEDTTARLAAWGYPGVRVARRAPPSEGGGGDDGTESPPPPSDQFQSVLPGEPSVAPRDQPPPAPRDTRTDDKTSAAAPVSPGALPGPSMPPGPQSPAALPAPSQPAFSGRGITVPGAMPVRLGPAPQGPQTPVPLPAPPQPPAYGAPGRPALPGPAQPPPYGAAAPAVGIPGPPVLTPQQEADLKVNTARRMPADLRQGGERVEFDANGNPIGAIKNPDHVTITNSDGTKTIGYISPPNPGAPEGTQGTFVPISRIGTDGRPMPLINSSSNVGDNVSPDTQAARTHLVEEFHGKDADSYVAAQNTQGWLNQIDHAADVMNHAGGAYQTGPYAATRLAIMNNINDAARTVGLKTPFDEKALASAQEMQKATTTAGFELSSHYEGHARQAAATIMNATSAVPGMSNSPQGLTLVSSGIHEGAQSAQDAHEYKMARYNGTDPYGINPAANGKTAGAGLETAETDFYKQFPASMYSTRAISTVQPVQMTAKSLDDFNTQASKYLPGTIVTVNGQQKVIPARPNAPPIPAYIQQRFMRGAPVQGELPTQTTTAPSAPSAPSHPPSDDSSVPVLQNLQELQSLPPGAKYRWGGADSPVLMKGGWSP